MAAIGELDRRFSAAIARGLHDAPEGACATVGFAGVDEWMPWLDQAGALLGTAERERVLRMKRPHDAAARMLAYALHRLFLGALLDIDARHVPVGRDGEGRPVVFGTDWRTSLSHADGAFAFAAVRAGPVGIDLERGDRAAGIADIEADICHPGESVALAGMTGDARGRALLEAWVRKEAYLKASGVGLAHAMAAFALPEGAVRPVVGEAGAGTAVETGLLALHPDYVLALSRPPRALVRAMRLSPD